VIVWLAVSAYGLDPNKTISEYIRDRWDAQQGFPGTVVYAIDKHLMDICGSVLKRASFALTG